MTQANSLRKIHIRFQRRKHRYIRIGQQLIVFCWHMNTGLKLIIYKAKFRMIINLIKIVIRDFDIHMEN